MNVKIVGTILIVFTGDRHFHARARSEAPHFSLCRGTYLPIFGVSGPPPPARALNKHLNSLQEIISKYPLMFSSCYILNVFSLNNSIYYFPKSVFDISFAFVCALVFTLKRNINSCKFPRIKKKCIIPFER